MTTSELLLQDYDMEIAMTRKLLERVPEDNPDFKPHEKSMPLGKLTMHVALMPFFGETILSTPSLNMATDKRKWPDSTFRNRDSILAGFDELAARCRATLAATSDEDLAATWKFSFGDRILSDGPKSLAYRHMFMNHLIHHRAQLGVYLRLNNLPVPGVYGPSADEQFKP
jgi:uncharacterized damage-inducible protein DinB